MKWIRLHDRNTSSNNFFYTLTIQQNTNTCSPKSNRMKIMKKPIFYHGVQKHLFQFFFLFFLLFFFQYVITIAYKIFILFSLQISQKFYKLCFTNKISVLLLTFFRFFMLSIKMTCFVFIFIVIHWNNELLWVFYSCNYITTHIHRFKEIKKQKSTTTIYNKTSENCESIRVHVGSCALTNFFIINSVVV